MIYYYLFLRYSSSTILTQKKNRATDEQIIIKSEKFAYYKLFFNIFAVLRGYVSFNPFSRFIVSTFFQQNIVFLHEQ